MIRISACGSVAAILLAAVISFYNSDLGRQINRTIGEAVLEQGVIAEARVAHNN